MNDTKTAALVAEVERLTKELAVEKERALQQARQSINLQTLLDSAQIDAERYRFLRQDRSPMNGVPFICRNNEGMFSRWTGGHADNAIDAAMKHTDADAKNR